jgi:hypothetical protein
VNANLQEDIMVKTSASVALGCSALALLWPAAGQAADSFVPADYAQPKECPARYDYQPAAGTCKAQPDQIAALKGADCAGDGVRLDTASGKCVPTDPAPAPQCKPIAGRTAKISGAGTKAACSYEATLAVSGRGDYIGDCFYSPLALARSGLKAEGNYLVTDQRKAGEDDRELTVVTGTDPAWYKLGCRALENGSKHSVLASELMESGAKRKGYAFGFLTMPYKYYPSDKSFVTGVPIGGYLGWRSGQAGSGMTMAAAVTLGSVKANTVDPIQRDAAGNKLVTGSADVAALSLAFGGMFDLLKSPTAKPFKAGVFVGWDYVNNEPSIDYRHNRKPWIAIQIGYDFTDN